MVKVHPKHKKLTKRVIYIGVAIVALFWLFFGATRIWNTNFDKILSNNAAVLTDVVATVYNLPDINTIEPSKTSGNLPGIASEYKIATESTNAVNLSAGNIFTIGFHAIKNNLTTLNKDAVKALGDTSYRLAVTSDGLLVTQRFIEYTPAVDLALYKSGEEQDASERLARTQAGIQGVIKALEESKLPYRKDIIDILTPLEKKATAVTPQTVDAWAADVLEAQNKILVIIKNDYDSNIGTSTKDLRSLSEQYLQLR